MPDSVLGAGETAEDERHGSLCPRGAFLRAGGENGEKTTK